MLFKRATLILFCFLLGGCDGFSASAPLAAQSPSEETSPPAVAKTFTIGSKTALGYNGPDATTTAPINTETVTNLVVFVAQQGVGAGVLVDNKGNTFVLAGSALLANGLDQYSDEYYAYYSLGAAGGAGHTFTYSLVDGFSSILAMEIKSDKAISFGQIITQDIAQTGVQIDLGSVTTTAASSLLVGFASSGEPSGSTVFDWLNGFMGEVEVGDIAFWQGTIGTKVVSPGSHSVAADVTETKNGTGFILEFK